MHRRVSPVAYLLLISDGMKCSVCKQGRSFDQTSMKGIRSAQGEDPLMCLVCEGVRNDWEADEGTKPLSDVGQWVREVKAIASSKNVKFDPAEWPEQSQYDNTDKKGTTVMDRDQEREEGPEKDGDIPLDATDTRQVAPPKDGTINADDEIFSWLKKSYEDLVSEQMTPKNCYSRSSRRKVN